MYSISEALGNWPQSVPLWPQYAGQNGFGQS